MPTPTEETHMEWQYTYAYFNTKLFVETLSLCLITMQRKQHNDGYFYGDCWAHHTGAIRDEIALNPAHFVTRSLT